MAKAKRKYTRRLTLKGSKDSTQRMTEGVQRIYGAHEHAKAERARTNVPLNVQSNLNAHSKPSLGQLESLYNRFSTQIDTVGEATARLYALSNSLGLPQETEAGSSIPAPATDTFIGKLEAALHRLTEQNVSLFNVVMRLEGL